MQIDTFLKRYQLAEMVRQPSDPTHIKNYALLLRKDADKIGRHDMPDKLVAEVVVTREGARYVGTILSQTLNQQADTSAVRVEFGDEANTILALQNELAKLI
jgi:hypothetical protein